jgi:hypothetical protein
MHTHLPTCLPGPRSGARDWWRDIQGPTPPDPSRPEGALPAGPADDDPTFRADLVARIRRQIAEGTYGTAEQWEAALDRLLKRLDEQHD